MSALKINKDLKKDRAKKKSEEKLKAQNSALKKIMHSINISQDPEKIKTKKKDNNK